jgi:hypothetical protein
MATSARRSTAAIGPSAVSGFLAKRAAGTFIECTSPAKARVTRRRTVEAGVGLDRPVLVGAAGAVVGAVRSSPRPQAAGNRAATQSSAATRAHRWARRLVMTRYHRDP